jgi:hypothetical protein
MMILVTNASFRLHNDFPVSLLQLIQCYALLAKSSAERSEGGSDYNAESQLKDQKRAEAKYLWTIYMCEGVRHIIAGYTGSPEESSADRHWS